MFDIAIIIRRNFLQPIVIAILILASILLLLGEARDAWFISVVILFNTLFAIVQEIRARQALRKLELMSAPRARRQLPDMSFEDIMYDQLAVGDTIQLITGDEVPADGKVIRSSGLEADESMLTGESTAVDKPDKAMVFAASAIVAGNATVQVTAIGEATKAGAMTATLKRYVPQVTPLQRSIQRVITFMTFGALALSALIGVSYYFTGQDAVQIFKTITSAAVTVVPEGLLLASTLLLAFGSLRLAQAKVLPQKLAAIEAMALLNVLCVDKTGTLTSDDIVFKDYIPFAAEDKSSATIAGIVARETSSGNVTGDAIILGVPAPKKYTIIDRLAFSSERKLSGVRVKIGPSMSTVFMGAPEFVSAYAPLAADMRAQIDTFTSQGNRVLLLARFDDDDTPLKKLAHGSGTPVGFVVLTNELRSGVTKTVDYLQRNDVSMRVISGDSLQTVQYVAASAGIVNSEQAITGADLATIKDEDEWHEVVAKTTIFARVLPEQKERIIASFKQRGNFTGMVGDGVNDALALKKADLGVAMFSGASATRRVADIVLLNNSFNSLPLGMRLGNRIMQAIEIITTLFFHKIIYGTVLLLTTIALGIVYPFEPRHVTFMNIFLVTMPTIMWTIFPPLPRHRLSPKHFLRDTLRAVAPIALISGIVVALSYAVLTDVHPDDPKAVSTTTVLIATFFGVYLVFLVTKMFSVVNNRSARIARLAYLSAVVAVVIIAFGFGFTRDFFDFTAPAWQNMWPLLIIIVLSTGIQWQIATRAGNRLRKRTASDSPLSR